jgi:hypothetical protein
MGAVIIFDNPSPFRFHPAMTTQASVKATVPAPLPLELAPTRRFAANAVKVFKVKNRPLSRVPERMPLPN